jgi:hypothetical protein
VSGFLGGGPDTGIFRGVAAKDARLIAYQYRGDFFRWFLYEDAYVSGDWYVNSYWPGGGASLDASGGEWLHSVSYDLVDVNTGALSKLGFSGYTRDINGVILGGCTVRLFRTSDGYKTCEVTSDPTTGWFVLDTPFYPDTHFYTAHKPSAVPEVAGASPSTLVAG